MENVMYHNIPSCLPELTIYVFVCKNIHTMTKIIIYLCYVYLPIIINGSCSSQSSFNITIVSLFEVNAMQQVKSKESEKQVKEWIMEFTYR